MLELRPASVSIPESHTILSEYFALRAQEFPGGAYTTVFPRPEAFEPPAGIFLLAGSSGLPVGCGGVRRIEDSSEGIRFEIKHLFLRPEARGHGWGGAIMDELERRAREWNAAELVLDTHHTLEAAAGLYARSGFEQIDAYNDNRNATRWYRKRLQ